jgi:hypothetical protein
MSGLDLHDGVTGTAPITDDLNAAVEDLPWELGLSKNPAKTEETVTFSSSDVGVLKQFVRVVPEHNSASKHRQRYRVEKLSKGQAEPIVVEEQIPRKTDAIDIARNSMERLTH